jgi:serine/threonine protein kinase
MGRADHPLSGEPSRVASQARCRPAARTDEEAPELTDDGRTDERADLYSFGATINEMAAGRRPSLEVARRSSQRAGLARTRRLSTKIYRAPYVASPSPCRRPVVQSAHQLTLSLGGLSHYNNPRSRLI